MLCKSIITIIGLGYVYIAWLHFEENHGKMGYYIYASWTPVSHTAACRIGLILYGKIIVLLWLLLICRTIEAATHLNDINNQLEKK